MHFSIDPKNLNVKPAVLAALRRIDTPTVSTVVGKFPAMAWGSVSGHGRYKPIRLNVPVTVGDMRVTPGDLLLVDENGCVKIPIAHAEEVLRKSRELLAHEKKLFPFFARSDVDQIAKRMTWDSR